MAKIASKAAIGSFADLTGGRTARLPSLCLVTGELVGPFKNGGLGTSMTGLVEFVAAQGAEVTVLYTGEVSGDLGEWKLKYKNAGINLETLSELVKPAMFGPLVNIGWTNAWTVYSVLRARAFDVVHFNDTVGEGVFCFLAKKQGLAFANTLLTLALHSPTEWILESNGHPSNWAGFCCFTTAERLSIANTDLLWGPSVYLLDWVRTHDYKMPDRVFNQQYVIPSDDLFGSGKEKIARAAAPVERLKLRKPTEIVFFGRLEERKGIRLFVNAITRLGPELEKRGVSVLFMGKPSSVNGIPADRYLAARSANWGFKWRIESEFNQQQAVDYLRSGNCLAVMASPVDNSPCTVYEALRFGLPFIAARTGGIPELIHPDDQKAYLFDYSVEALSRSLLRALDKGISNVRPSISVAENQARWLGMHKAWKSLLPAPLPKAGRTKWTVLIDHYTTGEALSKSLGSARALLGKDCLGITVLQRDFAPVDIAGAPDVTIIDDTDDRNAAAILRSLTVTGATSVLMLRSGLSAGPAARQLFENAVATEADVSIPVTHLTSMNAIMPVLGASAALSMIEGDFDSGGLVFSMNQLRKRLGGAFAGIDRTLPYLGIIEAVHAAQGEVWPLAEIGLSADHGSDLILPQMSEARRAAAYANMRHLDRYQSLTIARHYYRMIFPAAAPSPPSVVHNVIAATTKEVNALLSPATKRAIVRGARFVLGDRSELVLRKLKYWVRRGG